MVLWGGLRPIASRIVLDILTLSGLSIACLTPCCKKDEFLVNNHTILLLVSCAITLTTAGLTSRWPVTLPMLPILFLQGLRRIPPVLDSSGNKWVTGTISGLSMLFVVLSAMLSLLFPAVELPLIQGNYHVGVVDFFLPIQDVYSGMNVNGTVNGTCDAPPTNTSTTPITQHASVRLLYPTTEKPGSIPYLRPETAIQFCLQSMRFGAPPPLNKFGWILHTWRLTGLRAKRRAQLLPADVKAKLPLVVFSHGLGGDAALYSYQTMSLAAQGNLVLSVNHQDGSAPIVQTYNGSSILLDFSLGQLWRDGKHVEYVHSRRERTDLRVNELLAATDSFLKLNNEKQDPVDSGVSLSGRIQTDDVTFMGHSFGGATVLTAAKRRPDFVKSVIVHDPVADWMPDDSRRSLFASHLLEGLPHFFNGGTGGFKEERNTSETKEDSSVHDTDMLIMFSQQWRDKEWAWSHILEDLHRHGRLGRKDGFSYFKVIHGSNHNEFSDTCMLTPTWLARGVGVTGMRNPLHTAKEIEEATRDYLQQARLQRAK